MAESVIFKLKEPQHKVSPANQKETLIFMFFNFGFYAQTEAGKKYIPLKYSTGLKIKPCFWNDKPSYRAKQTRKFNYDDFNKSLDDIETISKTVYRRMVNEGKKVTPESFRDRLNLELEKVQKPEEINLNQYIKKFIQDCTAGRRLTEKKQIYKPLTIKNFKGFQVQFDEFQESIRKVLNYNDITIDLYDSLIQFFNAKNYSPNTIGRHIKNLKSIMRNARDEGLHSNFETERKKFKAIRAEVKNIYLSETELNKMYALNLSHEPNLELARDVFLVGCYTAQRFSDYSRIKKDNVRFLENGHKVIDLIQKKTGERVIIPVSSQLDELLKKYDYTVPLIYEQKLNQRIKDVGESAGIDNTEIIESIKGGMKVERKVFKFDLIKTHTARRSGCTNMYLAGIPSIDIMKISGHKTEKEFLKYINVTKEETAQSLSTHPYFNKLSSVS